MIPFTVGLEKSERNSHLVSSQNISEGCTNAAAYKIIDLGLEQKKPGIDNQKVQFAALTGVFCVAQGCRQHVARLVGTTCLHDSQIRHYRLQNLVSYLFRGALDFTQFPPESLLLIATELVEFFLGLRCFLLAVCLDCCGKHYLMQGCNVERPLSWDTWCYISTDLLRICPESS